MKREAYILRLEALYILCVDKFRAQGTRGRSIGSIRGAHRPSRIAITLCIHCSMNCQLRMHWHPEVGVAGGSPVLEMLQLLAQERCMKRWT